MSQEIGVLLSATDDVQMQRQELRAIARAIRARPGCSLLVFGCGNDFILWEEINKDGATAFIEEDLFWADKIRGRLKSSIIYLTPYAHTLSEWISLLNCPNALELELPKSVTSKCWDVIVIDGPAGHDQHKKFTGREAPGRMQSIYMASKLVAPGGIVFVHDCERLVEQQYAARYLGASRLAVTVEGHALLHGYAF